MSQRLVIVAYLHDETKRRINRWVVRQQWPEGTKLKDPDGYHITLLYAPTGYGSRWWHRYLGQKGNVTTGRLDLFDGPDGTQDRVVMLLGSPDLTALANRLYAEAQARKLEPVRFGEVFQAHITVAVGVLPLGHRPPLMTFRTTGVGRWDL